MKRAWRTDGFPWRFRVVRAMVVACALFLIAGCEGGEPTATPPANEWFVEGHNSRQEPKGDGHGEVGGTGDRGGEDGSVAPFPQVVAAHNRFGILVFQQLLSRGDESRNVFISPTSIALALSMAYNGADGQTEQEMAAALQYGPLLEESFSRNDINESNRALLQALHSLNAGGEVPEVQVNIANSIWYRGEFRLNDTFRRDNEGYYQAQVEGLDFARADSADKINGWVRDATKGLIPSVVDRLDDDLVMILINAVYFKGNWTTPFDVNATRPMPFHLPDGGSIDVPMMYRSGLVDYYRDDELEAIRLPYGADERLAMYVFLPAAGENLTDLARRLSYDDLVRIIGGLAPARGEVILPRMDVSYKSKLNEALRVLGMGIALDPARADFSRLLAPDETRRVYVSDVVHQAVLKVDEEGTEAAGVTSVDFRVTSVPVYDFVFKADRPFLIAIGDSGTGALLFLGAIVNPGDGAVSADPA